MRLSDYIGLDVIDSTGQHLGRVHDAHLIADGPADGPFGASLRLHAFLVGKGSLGARLGLDREEMRGPWLLKIMYRRRFREIPWSDIDHVTDKEIHLRSTPSGRSSAPAS